VYSSPTRGLQSHFILLLDFSKNLVVVAEVGNRSRFKVRSRLDFFLIQFLTTFTVS